MSNIHLSVREIQESDIPLISSYWLNASSDYLRGMGADPEKIPSKEQWQAMLQTQISQPYQEKQSYCLIWLANEEPVGHSNINKIIMGQEAAMHLHLWQGQHRQKGMGAALVKLGLPYFFNNYRLQLLYSEPYTLNIAPNKTLEKAGFVFEKEYETSPGSLNPVQQVKRWVFTREKFKSL
jgi:RimJ/RimL family protein N-acetyltransferase